MPGLCCSASQVLARDRGCRWVMFLHRRHRAPANSPAWSSPTLTRLKPGSEMEPIDKESQPGEGLGGFSSAGRTYFVHVCGATTFNVVRSQFESHQVCRDSREEVRLSRTRISLFQLLSRTASTGTWKTERNPKPGTC